MAAFELNIKAASLTDLELAIKELGARFPGLAEGSEPQEVSRTRRAGRPPRVAPAAHPAPAGEAQAAEDGADGKQEERLAGAADADAGAVEPEEAAEAGPAQGAEEAAGEEAADEGGAAVGVEGPAAEVESQAPEAGPAAEDPPIEGATAPAEALTIDTIKTAAKALIAEKGVDAAMSLFKNLGIAKPGQTPPEKFDAVMVALRAALA